MKPRKIEQIISNCWNEFKEKEWWHSGEKFSLIYHHLIKLVKCMDEYEPENYSEMLKYFKRLFNAARDNEMYIKIYGNYTKIVPVEGKEDVEESQDADSWEDAAFYEIYIAVYSNSLRAYEGVENFIENKFINILNCTAVGDDSQWEVDDSGLEENSEYNSLHEFYKYCHYFSLIYSKNI